MAEHQPSPAYYTPLNKGTAVGFWNSHLELRRAHFIVALLNLALAIVGFILFCFWR